MMSGEHETGRRRISPAEGSGLVALALALALAPVDGRLAVLPLAVFLLFCLIAPLLPGTSFFVPVISRGSKTSGGVGLTFDDGPDPDTTPEVLALLERHRAPATFFVNGQKVPRYPDLIRDILAQGHTIGNHTHHHDNFIMLKSEKALLAEIEKTQEALASFGISPIAFRPPVGVTSPRLSAVLKKTGMFVLNFSRRAGDLGNRRVNHISRRILKNLRAGDIIMLHDTRPHRNQTAEWLCQVDLLLAGIKERGLSVLPLADLIGRPVMVETDPS